MLIGDILFYCVELENKSWDVESVVKWYGINDKVGFKMVKQNILQISNANALSPKNSDSLISFPTLTTNLGEIIRLMWQINDMVYNFTKRLTSV